MDLLAKPGHFKIISAFCFHAISIIVAWVQKKYRMWTVELETPDITKNKMKKKHAILMELQ